MSQPTVGRVTSSLVASVPAQPSPAAQLRDRLREAAPPGQWGGVMAEVTRVQQTQSVSLLEAYETVLGKLAGGWLPSA
jgi:hypothetical protein